MEQSKGSRSIIRPLSSTETEKFLQDYKDIFYKSAQSADKNLCEKVDSLSTIQNRLDPNCILEIKKHLVRVEYPGLVENIDKAIETLGGIDNIETKVIEQNTKLELRFHPRNRYNRGCVASRNFKPGLLLKIIKNQQGEVDYEIVGTSAINFEFNRLCDFQYLPLVATPPETKESTTNNIHYTLIPTKLPDTDWFNRGMEESRKMASFLPPMRFSNQDTSGNRFVQEDVELVKEAQATPSRKKIARIFGKNRQQTSIFLSFKDKDAPEHPLPEAVKALKRKGFEEQLERVKQLFAERPIWTKAAIRYNTGLTEEQLRVILPVVGYHASNGPWRICWIKFGYDPRKDPKSRIYQTLDYRIRTADSTSLKVSAKRSAVSKTQLFQGPSASIKKVTLKDKVVEQPRMVLDERCYVLRPGGIPPARQMFYQLCDVIIPEIQEMISKVPKISYCDAKNGWIPDGFIERCRKIVNDHVLEAVQSELVKEHKEQVKQEFKPPPKKPLDYCNQMLDNVKRSLYGETSRKMDVDDVNIESIDLSSDEDDITVGDIIQNAIPETMEGVETEEESEEDDDGEIDEETLEEVKKIISG